MNIGSSVGDSSFPFRHRGSSRNEDEGLFQRARWCDVKFTPAAIPGGFLVDLEPIADSRGFFARSWCREEFTALGLDGNLAQCNISYNREAGTLRGMHYQAEPHGEAK